jgi:DsbC/DsbD-like thiol-disulfide interchange protein
MTPSNKFPNSGAIPIYSRHIIPGMARLVATIIAVLVLASAPLRADQHVRATLLASTSKIEAGKPFWVGVLLTIDPHWHVYWQNPGTAGLAPHVRLQLPDGFIATPLLFPTPHRFPQPGDIVAYGYEESVLLLAEVTPPDDLPKDYKTTLTADVSWLVCKEQCVMEKQAVSLPLDAEEAQPVNTPLFSRWRAQLPVDLPDSPQIESVKAAGDVSAGDNVTLSIHWKGEMPSNVEFFPDVIDDYVASDATVERNGPEDVVTLFIRPLIGKSATPATLNAVIGFDVQAGKRRGVKLKITLPKAAVLADNQ